MLLCAGYSSASWSSPAADVDCRLTDVETNPTRTFPFFLSLSFLSPLTRHTVVPNAGVEKSPLLSRKRATTPFSGTEMVETVWRF
jgi:hypothetical protein